MSHSPLEPTAGGGFDAHWLQQREPFDLAARDADLAAAFAVALPRRAEHPVRLVDLAAGTGANFRALAPQIGGDQDWWLIDHDPLLLAAQHTHIAAWASQQGWHSEVIDTTLSVKAGSARWQVHSRALDLATSLETLDLAHIDGVVTTAFLDLVSVAWLDRAARHLALTRRPLLATLTVDGQRAWQPPHPADAALHAAFLQHQAGDKGFGIALGPAAVAHLAAVLTAHGYAVHTAHSDWHINTTDVAMLTRMVNEAAAVAQEAAPADHATVARWLAARHAQIQAGALHLTVGHRDLLAL